MSDLVFEDSPLTRSNVDSRHGECWSDSRTTSRAALYRLAELVIDLVDTSEAPVATAMPVGLARWTDGRPTDWNLRWQQGRGKTPCLWNKRCLARPNAIMSWSLLSDDIVAAIISTADAESLPILALLENGSLTGSTRFGACRSVRRRTPS